MEGRLIAALYQNIKEIYPRVRSSYSACGYLQIHSISNTFTLNKKVRFKMTRMLACMWRRKNHLYILLNSSSS